jgi:hypothetical protein
MSLPFEKRVGSLFLFIVFDRYSVLHFEILYFFLDFLDPFRAGRSSETFAPPKVSNTSKGGSRGGGSWSPPFRRKSL